MTKEQEKAFEEGWKLLNDNAECFDNEVKVVTLENAWKLIDRILSSSSISPSVTEEEFIMAVINAGRESYDDGKENRYEHIARHLLSIFTITKKEKV